MILYLIISSLRNDKGDFKQFSGHFTHFGKVTNWLQPSWDVRHEDILINKLI